MTPKVFITRKLPVNCQEILLEHGYSVDVWNEEMPPSSELLQRHSKNSDALITTLSDKIDSKLLANSPNLKVITNFAVGHNNIDLNAAKKYNIKIGNTPGVLTDATADLAFALTLGVARNLKTAIANVESCEWKTWGPTAFQGLDLRDKTLGIIGMGRIGQRFSQIFQGAYGGQIIYTARSPKEDFEKAHHAKRVDLTKLLKNSDFISIHCDLNPETKNMISTEQFSLMKKTAVLVNTARGEIIDQEALYYALKEDLIFGVGLDVTSPEPLPDNSPLRELNNLLIIPHIGSATFSTRSKMAEICARNIIAGLSGGPLLGPVTT